MFHYDLIINGVFSRRFHYFGLARSVLRSAVSSGVDADLVRSDGRSLRNLANS